MCVYLVVLHEFLCVKRSQFVATLFYGEGMEECADTAEEVKFTSTCATFYGWKYEHYFVMVEKGEKIRTYYILYARSKTLSYARNTIGSRNGGAISTPLLCL